MPARGVRPNHQAQSNGVMPPLAVRHSASFIEIIRATKAAGAEPNPLAGATARQTIGQTRQKTHNVAPQGRGLINWSIN